MHRFWVMLMVVAMAFGCKREAAEARKAPPLPEPDAADTSDLSDQTAPPIPGVSPASANEKPGMAKARRHQSEYLDNYVRSQQEHVLQSTRALSEAEVAARKGDPELGRLYSELVNGQVAYRKALEQNAQYAEVKASNVVVLAEYSRLIARRDSLKEEMKHERD